MQRDRTTRLTKWSFSRIQYKLLEILCLFVLPANSIYLLPAVGLQCRGKGERPDCWTKLCIPGTGLNNAKETKEHKLTIIYTEFFNYDAKLSFFFIMS